MRSHHSGFTLLELVVTIAILAVLTSLALPSFNSVVANNRLATAANETLAAMMLARSEAFRSGRRVVVCTSSNASTCDASGAWSDGWIVFVDADSDGDRNGAETVLRVGPAVSGMTISGAGGAENAIVFTSRGATTIASGSPTVTFGISGYPRRELIVTPTGRVSISKGADYP